MKLTDEILNVAVVAAALLALVVQAGAHLLTPATGAAGLAPVDGTAHDLLIGCIGFLARNVVRSAPPAATGQ